MRGCMSGVWTNLIQLGMFDVGEGMKLGGVPTIEPCLPLPQVSLRSIHVFFRPCID